MKMFVLSPGSLKHESRQYDHQVEKEKKLCESLKENNQLEKQIYSPFENLKIVSLSPIVPNCFLL